jgi:hypothetical protein
VEDFAFVLLDLELVDSKHGEDFDVDLVLVEHGEDGFDFCSTGVGSISLLLFVLFLLVLICFCFLLG